MKKTIVFAIAAALTYNTAFNFDCCRPNFYNKPVLAEEYHSVGQNFYQSKKINEILKKIPSTNSTKEKAQIIYDVFALKNKGLKIDESQNGKRPPRLIDETLKNGGDCSEFAFVIAAAIKQLHLSGGALLVKMKNAPEDVQHIVVYVKDGNNRIIIDPQADDLNKVLDGSVYTVIADLSFEQLPYMFYREYGDYYRNSKNLDKAIEYYKRAVAIYEKDPYVLCNLANFYHKKDDLVSAYKYAEKALALSLGDKKKKEMLRIKVEYLVSSGVDECANGNTINGRNLLNEAKNIGEENGVIDKNDMSIIEENLKICK
ncbi:MAG: hypothetical protein QW153_00790 [Candidatus Bilamarchaeaceae archaeon]